MHNIGSVNAEWMFVPKDGESLVSKSWLSISPVKGILLPDETVEVVVAVCLTLEEAYIIATEHDNVSILCFLVFQ